MPRNASGVYSLPAGSIVTDGDTALASQHNTPLEDLKDEANAARPISAGGTGATAIAGAVTNLGLISAETECSAGGTANAITLTSDQSHDALVSGMAVRFTPSVTNTDAVTINLDDTGDVAAVDTYGDALGADFIAAGREHRAVYNGTNWVVAPPLATGYSEAEPGRLILSGAFGLGANLRDVSRTIGNASVENETLSPGFWEYDTANGSSGGPSGATLGHLLHSRRTDGGGEAQLMIVEQGTGTASPGTIWSRARTTGAWTDWEPAGVDSYGSNSGGSYVRLATGLQICWHVISSAANATSAFGSVYRTSSEQTWAFPASFAGSTYAVTCSPRNGSMWGKARQSSASQALYSVWAGSSISTTASVELLAIGTW